MSDASEHPTWFGTEGEPLFGWVHVPAGGRARGGVVLVPPIGVDAVAAHRALRELALRLADEGLAVLRFDLSGTGDSADRPAGTVPAPRLAHWHGDVGEAVAYLRLVGARQVAAVGMRLGATIAATAPTRLDALVLWDPFQSGKAFLREQQVLRDASIGDVVGLAPPYPDGSVEILGRLVRPELVADLRGLDLAQRPPGHTATQLLVLARDDRPTPAALRKAFAGDAVSWGVARGQAALLDVTADLAEVPVTTVQVISWWLSQTLTGPDAPITVRERTRIELRGADGTTIVERAGRFPPDGLFGILSLPPAPTPSPGPVVVFGNAGLIDHTGPARMWVSQSRALAAQGLPVLRVDLSGLGDSPEHPGQRRDIVYPPEALPDLASLAAALAGDPDLTLDTSNGPPDVVLAGLCSGAYHAMEAGIAGHARGVVAINPLLGVNTAQPVDDEAPARRAAAPFRPWIGRLRRFEKLAQFAELRLPPVFWWLLDKLRLQRHPAHGLELLDAAGVDTVLFCGEAEARPFQRRAKGAMRRLAERHRVQFEVLPSADHTLYGYEAREYATARLRAYLLETYRPASAADPPLDYRTITDPATARRGPALVPARRTSRPAGAEHDEGTLGGSRIGLVLLYVLLGVAVQALGYALARGGGSDGRVAGQTLFLVGLVVLFVPCAARLLGWRAERRERLQITALLSAALAASAYLLSARPFSAYPTLLHQAALWQLADHRTLFVNTSLAPVWGDRPGPELITLALHWTTGLPVLAAEVVAMVLVHAVLASVIFLGAELLVRPPSTDRGRAGSVAVLCYAAGPQFALMNGVGTRQVLALTFATAALWLVLRLAAGAATHGVLGASVCLIAMVLSDGLVGWITIGALALAGAALAMTGRSHAARPVAVAGLVALAAQLGWTILTASRVAGSRHALPGAPGFWSTLVGRDADHLLAPGALGTPLWQQAVLVVGGLALSVVVVVSTRALQHSARRVVLRQALVPLAGIAAALVLLTAVIARAADPASATAARLSGFALAGVGVVVAWWFVRDAAHRSSRAVGIGVAAAIAVLLAGVVVSSGTAFRAVPGDASGGASLHALDVGSLSAAVWVARTVPPGTHVLADGDDAVLMTSLADVVAVPSPGRDSAVVQRVLDGRPWSDYQAGVVRGARARLAVVDTRQYPSAAATFASAPGVRLVYAHDRIRLYDLSAVLGVPPLPGAAASAPSLSTLHELNGWFWPSTLLLGVTGAAWAWRARRRPAAADRLVHAGATTLAGAVTATALALPTRLPMRPLASGVLIGLLLCLVFTTLARSAPPQLRARFAALAGGTGLLGRFAYLVLTQVFVVGFGVVYWIVTAKLVRPAQIGEAAAAVSAATFVSAIAVLGVASLLLVELSTLSLHERRVALSTGVVVGGLTTAVLAGSCWLGAVLFVPHLGGSFGRVVHSPVDALLVIAGAVSTTVGMTYDAASIALRRSKVQLARNIIMSGLRVLLVVALATSGVTTATGLLVAWAASMAVSLVICPGRLTPRFGGDRLTPAAAREVVLRFWTSALRHHALNMAITSVAFFLPLLGALLLQPRDYAYFAVAQLISSTVMLVPALLATSLFAETVGDEALLSRHIRRTLPIGLGCSVAMLAILEPGAGLVLRVFGGEYAAHGATTLRLLLLGGVAYVIKDHFVAIRRAQGRLVAAARTVAVTTVAEAALTALGGALYGVDGLCGFWVLATVLEAAVFAPVVWRVVHGRTPAGPEVVHEAARRGEVLLALA